MKHSRMVRKSSRRRGLIALIVIGGICGAAYLIYGGGRHQDPGEPHGERVPDQAVAARRSRQQAVTGTGTAQILFGDLHVHTTFSADAFMRSLPLMGGEGAHPPADACDFARFCSSLDFYALTEHAETLTPRRWEEVKRSIRECNAVAGDAEDPDLVAFTGFEWTQVGLTPEEHYGHKNVIFREEDDASLPPRPIAAPGVARVMRNIDQSGLSPATAALIPVITFPDQQPYLDFGRYQLETIAVSECPRGVSTRDLPADCREVADTPEELFARLDAWGFEAMVIPHGTTWGFYTPPGYSWDKQLLPAQRGERWQPLIEVFSGHGNSEEYRAWRAVEKDASGKLACPAPTAGYEPCCHRAGEIVREQCGALPPDECERRVAKAREDYVRAGVAGHATLPGATPEDWKDCGQCRDCFDPSFNYRPGGAVQYIMAKGDFSDPAAPYHSSYGFIASSDNHSARPGTGYKELARRRMTDTSGPIDEAWRERIFGLPPPLRPESVSLPADSLDAVPALRRFDLERQASFFLTGGLVAVHSRGRSRRAIWDALERREVYGTSGDRILLWFDLVNGQGGRLPMGSQATLREAPRFSVKAAGAFVQAPGCPPETRLPAERVARLCLGECYNPTSERRRITRIEVVRIRPQRSADEPVEALIEDTWRRIECPAGAATCEVEIEDPDFVASGRDALYYARAIQEPTLAINADPLRCERDAEGRCLEARPCYGDYRVPADEDCLAENEERAWSSPIFVSWGGDGGSR